jgi:hypothetical protein
MRRSSICSARTKLIIFLGTPHRGSPTAGWGAIASNLTKLVLQDSNTRILDTLRVDSQVLDMIHEEFKKIISTSGIKVHTFQEARGISGMKGASNKVPEPRSTWRGAQILLEIRMLTGRIIRSSTTFHQSLIFQAHWRQFRLSMRTIDRW